MIQIEAKYIGLITGVAMIIAAAICYYGLHLAVTGSNQYIGYGIFLTGVIASLLLYKKNNPADESFKNYFSQGFKTFIVVALLMAVYTFIFYKLNPQILETAIVENDKLVAQTGDHTPAEIAENTARLRSMFMPMMIIINTIKYMIIGALVTLIGAGFLAQKRQ